MFGTSGVRGRFGEDVTADLALSIGRALATHGTERIVVGRDPRLTGSLLADAVSAGAREYGADVVRIGVAATPTIARSVGWYDADAGVAVTASHNPPEDNGLKLWTDEGMAFGEDRRRRIAEIVEEGAGEPVAWDETGSETKRTDATDRHREALTDAVTIEEPLSVVVDVGNGAGGVTVGALRDLGCSVTTLGGQPDGRFPSRPSEPTGATCETLAAHVAGTDADLGIAHDGDADRTMAVDERGRFLAGDELLALFAGEAVADGARVVAPVGASLVVDDVVEREGGRVERSRVGDVYVAERASEPGVSFGGEPSGAWIWPKQTLAPDGPLAACRLAALVARERPLSQQVAGLPAYPVERDQIEVDPTAKERIVDAVARRANERYDEIDERDGVRVETDSGWFLVRASGTQPLVRMTAQGRTEDRTVELTETARELITEALQTA
ncbi:phosphoglucosamine mutase [Salinarchaeum sp. Harcht-Bsk1]|uniref:phosphoglucosamine mutase n=1 Tax=Salinarchaeum sp. Harcht-Bsk1 TaxID=1333523 RepID=UPI0003422ED4|nr:phosphoglucosamine mutase [Salinarchaeum sp. Harcht-Bsk1]AGN02230.1 phosphoglucosamine mutase [Salinarchaeum sp. Harcht-Bsk1]